MRARVRVVGRNDVADGLLIDSSGRMLVTDLQRYAVRLRGGNVHRVERGDARATFIQSPLLRWPDTLAEGPDRALYVTTSQIQDSAFFVPTARVRAPDPALADRNGRHAVARSGLLRGRADHDLVDVHVRRLRDREHDGPRDVLGDEWVVHLVVEAG